MKKAWINKTIVTIYGKPKKDEVSDPRATSDIQDEGLYGMMVELLEEIQGTWGKIKTYYGYGGYVPLEDLYMAATPPKDLQRCFITKAYVDVLSLPKVQGICLMHLTRGAIITVLEPAKEIGGWVKIGLNDGKEGYVKASALGPFYDNAVAVDERCLRNKVVASAKSYLGTQYRWGGKSSLGIDCSGLCSMAYLLNGVKIYRDAKIVEGYPVHAIHESHKKPGDLLYFPGHMAMYIGDNLYIHATAHNGSDGVVINSLDANSPIYREDLAKQLSAVGSIF